MTSVIDYKDNTVIAAIFVLELKVGFLPAYADRLSISLGFDQIPLLIIIVKEEFDLVTRSEFLRTLLHERFIVADQKQCRNLKDQTVSFLPFHVFSFLPDFTRSLILP